jgi:hypothetical protein
MSSVGCTQTSCQYLVTYTIDPSGQNVVFEVSGNVGQYTYISVALSKTGYMGANMYAIACYNNNGTVGIANGHLEQASSYGGGFDFDVSNRENFRTD